MILKSLMLLLGSMALAHSPWDSVIFATTPQDLFEADQAIFSEIKSELRCQSEGRQRLFPKNCVVYAEFLALKPSESSKLKKILGQLEALCVDHISQVQSIVDIEEYLENGMIGPRCKNILIQRKKDLIYREH